MSCTNPAAVIHNNEQRNSLLMQSAPEPLDSLIDRMIPRNIDDAVRLPA
jgi:hypothetical protein